MKKILLGALALVIAAAAPALAQTHRANERDYRQEQRIHKNVMRGELTQRELRNIQRQQHRVDRTRERAARDGYITRAEQRQIERQQDRASRNIHRKSHNGRAYY